MDRRAVFFAVAALLAVVLTPLASDSLRWVPIVVSVTYVVLAAASYADARSNR